MTCFFTYFTPMILLLYESCGSTLMMTKSNVLTDSLPLTVSIMFVTLPHRYLIVGIMEVGERLLISFGSDALDAVQHAVYAAPAPPWKRGSATQVSVLLLFSFNCMSEYFTILMIF